MRFQSLRLLCTFAAAALLSSTVHAASNIHHVEPAADEPAIALSTRQHWMRKAVDALAELNSPCPFEAYGAVIVNHTSSSGLGDLICIGANNIASGNPTLHGEVAAINNCTNVLKDQNGPYKLSSADMQTVYRDLTLYTTAEPCPMCAAAIRWGGFKECVFGTSNPGLADMGWKVIHMRTQELFDRTMSFPTETKLLGPVLNNETDSLFAWQFDHHHACPNGCQRHKDGICHADVHHKEEL